jgi:tetratricopeptide (TPR) repeat protein
VTLRKIIMISSTALDLPEHRKELCEGCKKAGFDIRVMEELPALDADAIEASLEMVDEADIYIGVFAYRYGYVPEGCDISITEMEYNRAVERKIPRLIFFVDKDHLVRGGDVETGENVIKLDALKARIGGNRVASFFKSAKDLRAQVVEALANMASREIARERGQSEQEKEEMRKALQEANAALKRAETNPPAGESAASIETAREHLLKGDADAAERIFAEIAEREEKLGAQHNARAAEAYRNQAALAYLDNTEKAARLYAKAIALDPEDWSSLYRLSLIQARMGDRIAARVSAEQLLSLHNRLEDPRITYLASVQLGDLAIASGNGGDAERYHRQALEGAQQRAKSDPDDSTAQRDLSVSYNKIGDIRAARGDRDGALKSYEDGLAIRKALAERDPSNAEWQRDLSVSYNKIGDIRAARGDRDGALKSYEDGLAIRKALAERDPSNAEWQTDLAVSSYKIGSLGGSEACRHFQTALAILKRLDAEDRLAVDQKGWIALVEAKIAETC